MFWEGESFPTCHKINVTKDCKVRSPCSYVKFPFFFLDKGMVIVCCAIGYLSFLKHKIILPFIMTTTLSLFDFLFIRKKGCLMFI